MTAPLLQTFDRICVINLPERTDRRRAVERELRRAGRPVDGQQVRIARGIRPADAGPFPSTGARGCYLSHLEVLRQALADGVQRLLVLEDDVMFSAALRDGAALAPGLLGAGWDLAYPGHTLPARAGALRWVRTREPLVYAHCYAVSARALPALVAFLEACLQRPPGDPQGGPMHFDGALTMWRQAQGSAVTLCASRSLAGQRSSRSDIIGPSWLDRLPLLGGLGLSGAARGLRNGWRRLSGAL